MAHRTFSTHDLWPSLRFNLPHSVPPQSIMPETAPLPLSCFLHQSVFHWIVRIRETGAENTIYTLAAAECSDPRLAQRRGEPGLPALGTRPRPCEFNPKSGITSKLRHPRILSLNSLYSDVVRPEILWDVRSHQGSPTGLPRRLNSILQSGSMVVYTSSPKPHIILRIL